MYEYKIHVINRDLNLDPTYKNVVQVFNPLTNTKDYSGVFTNDELTFLESEEAINFDLQDGVNASVVLDLTSEHNYKQFGALNISLNNALSRQYCIIKETEKDDEFLTTLNEKLYFYFITDYSVLNENLIKYTLQIDAFMTYPLFSDIAVNKTKVARAHVDRFNLDNKFNLNNKFLETGEPIDTAYILSKKRIINENFKPNYRIKLLDNEMSLLRAKYFISTTKWLYIIVRTNDNTNPNNIFVAPICPSNIHYYMSIDEDSANFYELDALTLYNQLAENANVINAFISPLSPFGSYENNSVNSIYTAVKDGNKIIFVNPYKTISNYGDIEKNTSYIQLYEYATLLQPIFSTDLKAIYINSSNFALLKKNIAYFETEDITLFNEQLASNNNIFDYNIIKDAEIKTKVRQAYNKYCVKTELNESLVNIDLTYLKTNKLQIKVLHNFSPSSTGELAFTCNNLYNIDNIAFTKTMFTPQFYGDKFNEYKATNTNYEFTGIATPIITGTTAGAVAGAKIGGIYGAIAGAVVGAGASAVKVYTNYDNMQKTPDSVKFKGVNFQLDAYIKDYFFFIEHERLKDEEERQINMYFYEYGYNINDIVDLRDLFTRSSFNYIQLDNCEKDLHALINKKVLDVIIKALNDGVRFWTKSHYIASKFEYTTNNLETKLL